MPPPRQRNFRSKATTFCAGFVLGAAFMASPALGLALAIAAAFAIAFNTTKGQ